MIKNLLFAVPLSLVVGVLTAPPVRGDTATEIRAKALAVLKSDTPFEQKFDLLKAEFVGDPEANRLRSRAMREPWCV